MEDYKNNVQKLKWSLLRKALKVCRKRGNQEKTLLTGCVKKVCAEARKTFQKPYFTQKDNETFQMEMMQWKKIQVSSWTFYETVQLTKLPRLRLKVAFVCKKLVSWVGVVRRRGVFLGVKAVVSEDVNEPISLIASQISWYLLKKLVTVELY